MSIMWRVLFIDCNIIAHLTSAPLADVPHQLMGLIQSFCCPQCHASTLLAKFTQKPDASIQPQNWFSSFLSKSNDRCSGKAGIQMVSSIRSLVGLVSVTLWKLSVLSTWLSVTIFLRSCFPWQSVTSYQCYFLHLHLTFQAFSSLSGAAYTEPVAGLVSSSAILQQETRLEVNWTCATCLLLRHSTNLRVSDNGKKYLSNFGPE